MSRSLDYTKVATTGIILQSCLPHAIAICKPLYIRDFQKIQGEKKKTKVNCTLHSTTDLFWHSCSLLRLKCQSQSPILILVPLVSIFSLKIYHWKSVIFKLLGQSLINHSFLTLQYKHFILDLLKYLLREDFLKHWLLSSQRQEK